MQISTSSILFRENESTQKVLMENTSSNPLIFKIKITNTDLFSIAPGKGSLKQAEKTCITIKLNKICDINAKLLISYAEVEEITQETIDQQLAKIDKQHLQNKIISITRPPQKEKEEKIEEKPLFKKTASPTYQFEPTPEQQPESNNNNSKAGVSIMKKSSLLKSNSNMFKSVQDLDRRQTNLNRIHCQKLEKDLECERQLNKRMTERLLEREKKIMYYTNMKQLEINRSLNDQEISTQWNCCNVLLAVFVFIMIGFFLCKYDLPQHFSL